MIHAPTIRRMLAAVGFLWLGAPVHAQAQQDLTVPAFKVVAPNGQESILIGDLHVGVPGLRQPTSVVFENARQYVIEHHDGESKPADSAKVHKKAPWAEALSSSELETYFARAKCLGLLGEIRAVKALTHKSAQVANQLAYTVCDGGGTPTSRAQLMNQYATAKGLKPEVLEDAKWVETQRGHVPDDVAEASLRWILQRDPKTVLAEVVQAMNEGDYTRILEVHERSMGGAKSTRIAQDLMLTERNLHWMPSLRRYLDKGRAVVFVGAGHFAGPGGLVELLRAQGYAVSVVGLPARPQ